MNSLMLLAGTAATVAGQVVDIQNLFVADITVNTGVTYQKMIGGGCSGAFGAACTTNSLSTADQLTVVKTLYDENIGGLSVLRNIIGSSRGSTILPTCPATPSSPVNYTDITASGDSCQFTLAQRALTYNPDLFIYADAWSAPGCFKDNGVEDEGGSICGVRRTNCTYDWRLSYSNYLIQYVKFYEARGVKISMLGAYNEPDFNPFTYSSMLSDGFQAFDFLSVHSPNVRRQLPGMLISCCDDTGARQERDLLYELGRLGGLGLFDVNTYHNYQSDVKEPFSDLLAGQPSLMTEWSDGGSTWTPTWDISGNNFEGMQWAIYMHNAFIKDVAGWVSWWCTWSGPDAPLVLVEGASYQVAARLWAMAGYFRFARPGAMRVDAESNVEEVRVTAWTNPNGTIAIPVINSAHYAYKLNMQLYGSNVTRFTSYLTNNDNNVTRESHGSFTGGKFSVMIEPRSFKTFYLDSKN